MPAHHDDKSNGLLPAALLAVVVALVGLAGAVKIARTARNEIAEKIDLAYKGSY